MAVVKPGIKVDREIFIHSLEHFNCIRSGSLRHILRVNEPDATYCVGEVIKVVLDCDIDSLDGDFLYVVSTFVEKLDSFTFPRTTVWVISIELPIAAGECQETALVTIDKDWPQWVTHVEIDGERASTKCYSPNIGEADAWFVSVFGEDGERQIFEKSYEGPNGNWFKGTDDCISLETGDVWELKSPSQPVEFIRFDQPADLYLDPSFEYRRIR